MLVLGGGFAGIGAAQNLKKSDADVVVVDKHDYHTFQPLLYQVATGLLEQPAVGHPIRDLFHKQDNVRIHQDRVTAIDLDARQVTFDELEPLSYDYLVFGARRGGQLLRRRRGGRARVPAVHAAATRCGSRTTSCARGRTPTGSRR